MKERDDDMKRNRVVLHICGQDFPIATDSSIAHVRQLGEDINAKMSEILSASKRVTFAQAAILTALDYADIAKKNEQSIEALRSQLSGYLSDAEDSKLNFELVKKENEKLKAEIEKLKAKVGK